MTLTDEEVRQAASLISHERLATFAAMTGTDRDAVDLHRLAMALNGSLSPILATIEVALRNATCERLRVMFDTPDWLTNPPAPFEWRGEEKDAIRRAIRHAQRAVYTKMNAVEKKALDAVAFPGGHPPTISHEERSKTRQRAIHPSSGQVIAHLTFQFWKRLVSADYSASLWQRSLKRLFPDKTLTRGAVAEQIEFVYQARNRIAHHEPIYGTRLANLLQAIDFLAQRFGTNQPDINGILARLLAPYLPKMRADAQSLEAMIGAFRIAPDR